MDLTTLFVDLSFALLQQSSRIIYNQMVEIKDYEMFILVFIESFGYVSSMPLILFTDIHRKLFLFGIGEKL